VIIRDPAEFGALVAAARFTLPQVQVAIDLGGFVPTVADWLDEPTRQLEWMAGIADARGAQRIRATPTFSSVPAALDHPSAANTVRGWGWPQCGGIGPTSPR